MVGEDSLETRFPDHWKRVHALGLPAGSVRALLAVLIFATTWGLLVWKPAEEIPDYLGDLLFIIMGHYFASRRRRETGDEPGPPPLYLPRGSIRLILVAGCLAVAGVLYRRGDLTALDRNRGVVTLLLVGGFLIGVMLNAVTSWWNDRGHSRHRIFEDLRALVSIGAGVALVALIWNHEFHVVPTEPLDLFFSKRIGLGRFGPEHVLTAVVGFYFGSRS
jgi:hypothetical protein